MTITTARAALLFAVLLAATTRSSHAFQLAQTNSPLLLHATNNRNKVFASPANHNNLNLLDLYQSRSAAIATMLHASSNINTDDDTKDITDVEKANTTAESNKKIFKRPDVAPDDVMDPNEVGVVQRLISTCESSMWCFWR